jgi:hypothetical protein
MSTEETLAKKLWPDATPDILAATIEAAVADAKTFGGGLGGMPESTIRSHLEAAHAKVTAAAKLNGSAGFAADDLEYITDVRNTYTKRALRQRIDASGKTLAPNPGTLRAAFIRKYGIEKHNEAMKLTGATTDLRVAGRNPWKGNKAVKAAFKATQVEDSSFNRVFNSERIAQPLKAKPTQEQKSSNPFLAQNWNLTAQSKLYKLSPDLASSMAARARVRFGATKPVM